MCKETDWLELWRELTELAGHRPESEAVKRYRAHAAGGRERPDPLLERVLDEIDSSTTVLDIGAGNGRWSIPCARNAAAVTACEPSPEMRELLAAGAASAGLNNISFIPQSWEDARPRPHDIIVCAHAMYASPDLRLFIDKMDRHARRTCYLSIRLPPADGIIGRLSRAVYGRMHDSPNAVIACNALYQMSIYASVQVEQEIHPWTNRTFEEAFARARRHLHLGECTDHDGLIRATLKEHLTVTDEGYIWPDGMRSALLWWHPA